MSVNDELQNDHKYAIRERAAKLHPGIIDILLACNLPVAVDYAKHQLSRVKAEMYWYPPEAWHVPYVPIDQARGNEMAWFPPDHSVFGGDVLSALLTVDGTISPSSVTVGWVQVHIGTLIWWGWRAETELAVEWSDVFCMGNSLHWQDEQQRRWRLDLTPYLASGPPAWPDWLIPGGPS